MWKQQMSSTSNEINCLVDVLSKDKMYDCMTGLTREIKDLLNVFLQCFIPYLEELKYIFKHGK